MKFFIIRVSVLILFSFLFVFLGLKKVEPPQIVSQSKAITVPVKIIEKTEIKVEVKEGAKEEIKEEVASSEIPYLGSFIDADSVEDSNFDPPILDLSKIFSKIVYPASMKKWNIESSFAVRVNITASGAVEITIPEEVPKDFADSVKKAFNKAKAVPAYLNLLPVDSTFLVPVSFSLR